MDKELIELIKAIRNRCDVCLILDDTVTDVDDLARIYPTILEDLHEDSQEIIDKYCIVKDD